MGKKINHNMISVWEHKAPVISAYHFLGNIDELYEIRKIFPSFKFTVNAAKTRAYMNISGNEFEIYKNLVICFRNDEPFRVMSYAKLCEKYKQIERQKL